MKRIGIFHYRQPFQIHTTNIVNALLNAGFGVDMFFHGSPYACLTFDELPSSENFQIHNVKISYLSRIYFRLYQELQSTFIGKRNIIHPSAIKFFNKLIDLNCFCVFVGIEKAGLIWAGEISRRFSKTPVINYSLELYDDDHPFFIGIKSFPFIRKAEILYANRLNGLIVQDSLREAEYRKYNRIEDKNNCSAFFLPVSINGSKCLKKRTYWHDKYQLKPSQKILLIFGSIKESRQSIGLASECSKLGSNFVTIFHGRLELAIDRLTQYCGDNVYISYEMVPEYRIIELISSSDAGIVLYRNNNSNDRLTALSSEKLARFMQCGIPIIASDNISYRRLMNEFRCGELIESLAEIPVALKRIFSDYQSYQVNCYKAFEKYYKFQSHECGLIEFIENVVHEAENMMTYRSTERSL